MPKVSIIMGIYNCEKTLEESIQSIINQTYENWEFIICDDCSEDRSYEIAKKYKNLYPAKIKLIRNNKNLKLANTLNNCLKLANGKYIARMDGDDISLSNRLEILVEFLEKNLNYDLVGSQMISFDENGDVGIKAVVENPDRYYLRFRPPFAHATIMARKHVFNKLGGYRVSKETRRCEDVDLWFRFFNEGFNGYNIQKPLYKVRESMNDFKRRSFIYGFDAAKVSYRGFKLLNYPKRYYLFLLKPIISNLIPSTLMKKVHNRRDKRLKMDRGF